MQRVDELKALPRISIDERSLPPRPNSDAYTDASSFVQSDNASLYGPVNDADPRPWYPPIDPSGYQTSDTAPRPTAVPPRRDSLYSGSQTTIRAHQERIPPIPMSRSTSSENILAISRPTPPLSPNRNAFFSERLQSSSPDSGGLHPTTAQLNRDSFMFGAPALSPRFSPRKADEYGVTRPESNGSDASQLSGPPHDHHSSLKHSASPRNSGEVSTSWLNTIDESGSSNGELSPEFTRNDYRSFEMTTEEEQREIDAMGPQFQEDFDTQLDAAVEAAYGVYEVDYSLQNEEMTEEEEMMMLKSPRENVERAKERVRAVEREIEKEQQKEQEQRERMGYFKPQRESDIDMDFFEGLDEDDSEEERLLEEMTKGYRLDDSHFDRDAMTALPKERESSSTQYTADSVMRGSNSSGYSGTTWGSTGSAQGISANNNALTTVTEAPSTPPLHELPSPPDVAKYQEDSELQESPSKPPPPPPVAQSMAPPAINGVLAANKSGGLRSRRLSALSEGLEPLKIESPGQQNLNINTTIPTTIIQGASPLFNEPRSAPANDPPPIPNIPPLNVLPKSPRTALPPVSRPGTSNGLRDLPIPESPDEELPVIADGTQTPPISTLQKTLSDEGLYGMARAESPAKFQLRMPVLPLRQIHSSASLRSRNHGPSGESPVTPNTGLFASSSTSNLRNLPRSTTPATPSLIPMTPMHLPNGTSQSVMGGMSLFDGRLQPDEQDLSHADDTTSTLPVPLEPCPIEALSKPFWLMRALYQTIAHPRGGFISTRLFVPREVWSMKGVKLKSIDDKISACDLVTAALLKLATVKQDEVNAIFEEMQSLENVLERVQQTLTKRLGNEVGSQGARALYGDPNASTPDGVNGDMITKHGITAGSSRAFFHIRKLRTKASSTAMAQSFSAQSSASSSSTAEVIDGPSLPTIADSAAAPIPKRNLDAIQYSGPHAQYIAALAKLFDSAQILGKLIHHPFSTRDTEHLLTP